MATEMLDSLSAQMQRVLPTNAAIAAMAERYLLLKIAGPDDGEGFGLVHTARMFVKNKRVEVEKIRKELKADALEYGRTVDAEAKRITGLLLPIETHLDSEESAYTAAKEAIRNAARLKAEREALAAQQAEEARVKAIQDAENERLRVEREALEAERRAMEAEQALVRAEQKAAQDKINRERQALEAEQKRLADVEAEKQRKIEIERLQAEAAERSRIETEARIERERVAAEKVAEAMEAKRLEREAMRPDKEKLRGVADAVDAIEMPAVSVAGSAMAAEIEEILADTACRIRQIAE